MIRVLVVDDSAMLRRSLIRAVEKSSGIKVVGEAGDPYEAREKLLALAPDVMTLDIEMPRMDGLTFLSRLMQHHPIPVVMLSSSAGAGTSQTLQALKLGAVAVVRKPECPADAPRTVRELVAAIRTASQSPVSKLAAQTSALPFTKTRRQVLAIGASTGGTVAIDKVLRQLSSDVPPTLLVQHMPEGFTEGFAQRLNRDCPMDVREAKHGDHLRSGLALLAPAGYHMILTDGPEGRGVVLDKGPPVHHQRPAVDVTFDSVARLVGADAFGILLTGMGGDGGDGMLSMRQAGAWTAAQDEASCVVFGMPRVAIEMGGVSDVVPLHRMGEALHEARLKAETCWRTRSA